MCILPLDALVHRATWFSELDLNISFKKSLKN